MKYLLMIILLSSCAEPPPSKDEVEMERLINEFTTSLPVAERAAMMSCYRYSSFSTCYDVYLERQAPCKQATVKKESSATSILKTAAGTALGYGAAKLILSK